MVQSWNASPRWEKAPTPQSVAPGLSSSGEESTEALQKKTGTSPPPCLLRAEQGETSPDHSQKKYQIPGRTSLAHRQGTSGRRVWASSKVKVGKETVLEEPVDPVSRRFRGMRGSSPDSPHGEPPLGADLLPVCSPWLRDRAPFVFTSDMAYVINGGDKPSSRFHDFVDLCCQAYNLIRKHTHLFLNLLGLVRSSIPF